MTIINETDIDKLLELLGVADDVASARQALELIHEDDSGTIAIACRLIASGGLESRSQASKLILRTITDITAAVSHRNTDPEWRDRCKLSWSPHLKEGLLSTWHFTELENEVHPGETKDYGVIMESTIEELHIILYSDPDPKYKNYSDSHWRGLTALAITEFLPYGSHKEHEPYFKPFVEFAGNHDDTPRVIKLAIERAILNPEILKPIMEEQDEYGVLSDGLV